MLRLRRRVSALSLVLFPLCILAYWVLYPAYGLLDGGAILRSIIAHPMATLVANVFALAGSFLAVPATLALMRVLDERSPRLAFWGGSLAIAGWIALVGVLMGDVVAVQLVNCGVSDEMVDLYKRITFSLTMLALTGVVLLHVVGGVLIGIALWRTRIIPRWAGIVATVAQPIHFVANLNGILWLDSLTWISLAVVYGYVARIELQTDPVDQR